MTQVVVQIVTTFANRANAITLSTPAGGVPESNFTAPATTDPTGHGAAPTHCWCNGFMDDFIIALFQADTVNYQVTFYPNRNPWPALSGHTPILYPYLGP
jgi:hypothetical protein